MDGISVYAIIDRDNILDEKESPSDNPEKWAYLVKNNIYKIKGGGEND
jgi:DNA primase